MLGCNLLKFIVGRFLLLWLHCPLVTIKYNYNKSHTSIVVIDDNYCDVIDGARLYIITGIQYNFIPEPHCCTATVS